MNSTMESIINTTQAFELSFLPREWVESSNNDQLVACTIGDGAIGGMIPAGLGICLLALGRLIQLFIQHRNSIKLQHKRVKSHSEQ